MHNDGLVGLPDKSYNLERRLQVALFHAEHPEHPEGQDVEARQLPDLSKYQVCAAVCLPGVQSYPLYTA